MNKPLAIFCGGLAVLGLLMVVGCWLASVEWGWYPVTEGTEEQRLPLEALALGGAVCFLLAPLFYLAGREERGWRGC